MQTNNTKHAHRQLEAQRWQAEQAARERPEAVLLAAALERAGELAELGRLAESKRVLELNYFNAK